MGEEVSWVVEGGKGGVQRTERRAEDRVLLFAVEIVIVVIKLPSIKDFSQSIEKLIESMSAHQG